MLTNTLMQKSTHNFMWKCGNVDVPFGKLIHDLSEDLRHFTIGPVVPRLWDGPSGRSDSDTACDGSLCICVSA